MFTPVYLLKLTGSVVGRVLLHVIYSTLAKAQSFFMYSAEPHTGGGYCRKNVPLYIVNDPLSGKASATCKVINGIR